MADVNMFVEDGEETIVSLLAAIDTWYVAYGTDSTEAIKADVALIAESADARGLCTSTNVDPDVAAFVGSITAGSGQTIKELGLLTANVAGTLIARGNKAAGWAVMLTGDIMQITCTIALS